MFRLDDKWVWDFWFARRGDEYHMFYLQAPRSLGDERLRHRQATIGHAISGDLRHWEVLADALSPGEPGSWDDLATWTGCVVEADGRWHMFYTGISTAEDGLVQRIGVAHSDDLETWTKDPANPVVTADPRWYEQLGEADWHNQAWRDPWVYRNPDTGDYGMLITARSRHGAVQRRGVVGHARSSDLHTWRVGPPVAAPEVSGDLEVPQLVRIGSRSYILFCSYRWADQEVDGVKLDGWTIGYLEGEGVEGPFNWGPRGVLVEGRCGWYGGRLVEDTRGRLQLLAWRRFDDDGNFVGEISDPMPIDHDGTGLVLRTSPPVSGQPPANHYSG